MPIYKFQFRPYQRPFRQPLKTSHGSWEVREGVIVRLSNDVGVGFGEIAPLPWFGSETLALALSFCDRIGDEVTDEIIAAIPDNLSATQFGFESALFDLRSHAKAGRRKGLMGYSFLLPAGDDALSFCQKLIPSERSPITFKWKIGVGSPSEEIDIFHQLIRVLPTKAKLRLDANGGLTFQEACQWLGVADEAGMVEFIEQPLPPIEFERMLELSAHYATPLALDESVCLLGQLQDCYARGWRGIFVIKAAIAGYPSRLRQFCLEHEIDAVFSSVFETAIGRKAALNLACELNNPNRAVGFGVDAWF